jgi:hypothetical protein
MQTHEKMKKKKKKKEVNCPTIGGTSTIPTIGTVLQEIFRTNLQSPDYQECTMHTAIPWP